MICYIRIFSVLLVLLCHTCMLLFKFVHVFLRFILIDSLMMIFVFCFYFGNHWFYWNYLPGQNKYVRFAYWSSHTLRTRWELWDIIFKSPPGHVYGLVFLNTWFTNEQGTMSICPPHIHIWNYNNSYLASLHRPVIVSWFTIRIGYASLVMWPHDLRRLSSNRPFKSMETWSFRERWVQFWGQNIFGSQYLLRRKFRR